MPDTIQTNAVATVLVVLTILVDSNDIKVTVSKMRMFLIPIAFARRERKNRNTKKPAEMRSFGRGLLRTYSSQKTLLCRYYRKSSGQDFVV